MDPNQVQQSSPNPETLPVQPLPIEPPQLPPEMPKAKKMPTLLAVILIVILLGGLSARTYMMNMKKTLDPNPKKITKENKPSPTKTPIPTLTSTIPTNWKTYTNTKYTYSLSYPPEITYDELPNGDVWFYRATDGKTNKTPTGFKESLSIIATTGTSPEAAAFALFNKPPKKKVTFNNVAGISMDPTENFPLDYHISPIGKNTPILRIYISADYSTGKATRNEDLINQFSQMTASFNFIDQNQAEIPSDWKTFDNGKYTLSYPKNWTINTDPNYRKFNPDDVDLRSPDFTQGDTGFTLTGFHIMYFFNKAPNGKNKPGIKDTEEMTWFGSKANLETMQYESNQLLLTGTNKDIPQQAVLIGSSEEIDTNKKVFLEVMKTIKIK